MKKKFALLVSASVSTVLLLWFIGEVLIRLLFPYWTLDMALQYSPSLFSKHIITPEKQIVRRRADPSDTLTINSLGFRGDEIKVEKPEEQTRIMIYGGSQVFSAGTGQSGWPERIENQLKKTGYSEVQVINAGTPGHASFDSLGRFYTYGHYLKPDYVVLNNTWNDLKYFHLEKPPLTELEPYVPSENPRRNYLSGLDRLLGETSQFYLWLRNGYFGWNVTPERYKNFYRETRSNSLSEQAMKQYRLTLRTFVDLVRNTGARPILMKQPRLVTSTLSGEEREKIRYQNLSIEPSLVPTAYRRADRILQEVAEAKDVPLLDFRSMNGNADFFFDHVHLTPNGSNDLSRAFARTLKTDVLN